MSRLFGCAALYLAMLLGSWPVSAEEEGSAAATFRAASEAFEEGNYAVALQGFEAAVDAGMQGPAVRYNIGVCQYKLGDYAAAEATFRALAEAHQPMRPLAEYNRGLSLLGLGRRAEAVAAFEVASLGEEEVVARLAEEMLARLAPDATTSPAAEGRWARLVDVGVGHDDNVALLDETTLPAGRSTDSPFAEVLAIASGRLAALAALRVDASAYLVRYSDASEFHQDLVRIAGAWEWLRDGWSVTAGPHYSHSRLGGEGLERRLGVSTAASRLLSDRFRLALRFSYDDVEELEREFAFLQGSSARFGLGLDHLGLRALLSFRYERESNDRGDPSVSPQRDHFRVRYRQQVSPLWSLDLEWLHRASSYDDVPQVRSEDLSELGLALRRDLPEGWSITGQYRRADNDSNVEAFSYTRNRFLVGIAKDF